MVALLQQPLAKDKVRVRAVDIIRAKVLILAVAMGGKDAPWYKPARSEPWVRCHCPNCPGFAQRVSFKYVHQIQKGAKCQGWGTDWDFSLAVAVRQGEVPGYKVLDEREDRQVGPFAPAAGAGSPFKN